MDVESHYIFGKSAGVGEVPGKRIYNLLIATTGSVATLKITNLIQSIRQTCASYIHYNIEVRMVVTENSKHFFSESELREELIMYDDQAEWDSWKQRGDTVVHVELGKWADMLVIAPLDANTLAKMSQGICDNLVTCTTRAWDMSKPILFCPAMNTRMWEHPVTAQQISTLKRWGYVEIPPVNKKLMCGDSGVGAMAEIQTIVEIIRSYILQKDYEMRAQQKK